MTAEKHKHIVKVPARNELLKAGDVQEDEFKRIYDQMKLLADQTAKAAAAAASAQQQATAAAAAAAAKTSRQEGSATDTAEAAAQVMREDAGSAPAASAHPVAQASGYTLGISCPPTAEQAQAAAVAPMFGAAVVKKVGGSREGEVEGAPEAAKDGSMDERLVGKCAGKGEQKQLQEQKEAQEGKQERGDSINTSTSKRQSAPEARDTTLACLTTESQSAAKNEHATPARTGNAAAACGELASGGSTVRKVNARRPAQSAVLFESERKSASKRARQGETDGRTDGCGGGGQKRTREVSVRVHFLRVSCHATECRG